MMAFFFFPLYFHFTGLGLGRFYNSGTGRMVSIFHEGKGKFWANVLIFFFFVSVRVSRRGAVRRYVGWHGYREVPIYLIICNANIEITLSYCMQVIIIIHICNMHILSHFIVE